MWIASFPSTLAEKILFFKIKSKQLSPKENFNLSQQGPSPTCCLQSLSEEWGCLLCPRWPGSLIFSPCFLLMGSMPLSTPMDSQRVGGLCCFWANLGCGKGRKESLVRLGMGTKSCLLRRLKHPSGDNLSLLSPPLPSPGEHPVPLHLASSSFPSKEPISPSPHSSTYPSPSNRLKVWLPGQQRQHHPRTC